jgi:hypothetical protein
MSRDPLWMEGNDLDDDIDELDELDEDDEFEEDPDRLHDGFYDD